jgi:hypothetical protein
MSTTNAINDVFYHCILARLAKITINLPNLPITSTKNFTILAKLALAQVFNIFQNTQQTCTRLTYSVNSHCLLKPVFFKDSITIEVTLLLFY